MMDETTQTTTVKERSKTLPIGCKICGAAAWNSYVSVVTCPSCKIFFRRNARINRDHCKCSYNGHCEINVNNRRCCSSCRLEKCFASGMQVDMLRANRTVKNKTNSKEKGTKVSSRCVQKDQLQQFPILSLLQPDESTLTSDEWKLLSNLTACDDEYNGVSLGQRFIEEQNKLPLKMRFKLEPVREFFTLIRNTSQLLYEKNTYFISLCLHDRSILFHNTIRHVSGLSTCFIARDTRLLNNDIFNKSTETIYGSSILINSNHAIDLLNSDSKFVELVLVLLIFSTLDYTYYTNVAPVNLLNIKAILHIQDMYSKLTWRYLLYKYGYNRAVICISNLIRCIFFINDAVVKAVKIKQYRDMIDSLVKQTEEKFRLTK